MEVKSHTIFPNLFQNTPDQIETRKISYWLKKLFDQQEQKIINDKGKNASIEESGIVQSLPFVENKSPPLFQKFEMSPEEKGIDEQMQSQAKKKEHDRQRVENMVKKSNRLLFSISSIFPFTFFPTTINLEETRITIIYRAFFFSAQQHSIDIKDISNIFVETIPFFATLTIVSRTYTQNDIKITWLKKREAVYLRKLVEGLRIYINEDIDTCDYEREELVKKLEALSTTKMTE